MPSAAPTISESLLTLPADWDLVPVVGKRPIRKGWTKSNVDRLACLKDLESGRATGIGLKLGEGLLAIDIDGESAAKLLTKLAGENSLADFSKTTAWTSGRPGRKQCLFSVPEADWHRIRYRKITTGTLGEDGKEECLEFRWIGHQSVLPPSIHPSGKPYIWINDPLQNPPVQAPEWLLEVCENWHSEYVGDKQPDLVRFPARLYAHFGGQMRIWLLARRFDLSRWSPGGKPTGCGIGTFALLGASRILNLSKKRVYTLLCEAKKSGLIREWEKKGDQINVYYTSFEKVVAIAGLEDIGPIAAINIDELSYLNIIATEIEAQHLQRASLYRLRQEEIEQIKSQGLDPGETPSEIVRPIDLHTCDYLARVLGKGERFIYCSGDFRFYGGSQKAIADNRGLSATTISRHLSNSYRLVPSPVRECRGNLPPIVSRQLVEKLPQIQEFSSPKLLAQDGLFKMHGDWWEPHCNVYLLDHQLVSARRRRNRIQVSIDKGGLLVENRSPGDLEDKFLL